jgi:hypothetical protein
MNPVNGDARSNGMKPEPGKARYSSLRTQKGRVDSSSDAWGAMSGDVRQSCCGAAHPWRILE